MRALTVIVGNLDGFSIPLMENTYMKAIRHEMEHNSSEESTEILRELEVIRNGK